jgi:glutathione synthase/RimK-type ligase-like ATP-grasp enzyme
MTATTDEHGSDTPGRETRSTLRRMCWIFPDRESRRSGSMWRGIFWDAYAEVAEELGMSWTMHSTDAVAVDGLEPGRPRVYVEGEPVTPADTLFITALYSLPYQSMDIFNQYALYAVLEQTGFYLPFPPGLSPIANDKLTALLFLHDSPIPPIPTVRIGTGRDVGKNLYDPVLDNLTFPAIVKPAGWCAGGGVNLARTVEDVRGLASLAQGGDTTLVCQPYLGDGTTDYRVYVIDGKPHATLRRIPMDGSPVSSGSRGGRMEYVPTPSELADVIPYFAEKIPIPFFCADFLYDGERFWLSEIEPDGVVAPNTTDDTDVAVQKDVIKARFLAYREAHAQWQGRKV